MNAIEILEVLDSLGVSVRINERDKLTLNPKSLVTPELAAQCQLAEPQLRRLVELRMQGSSPTLATTPAVSNGHSAPPPPPDFAQPPPSDGPICWRCGSGAAPSLNEQVALLRSVHKNCDEIYQWPEREWAKLAEILEPGDLIEMCRSSMYLPMMPDYSGVWIIRRGVRMYVSRKQLGEV